MKDYYYILGVKNDATAEHIKSAYRKLSKKFHPDNNEGDEFFTERFKEIQEAYEFLGDPLKRSVYDTQRKEGKSEKQSSTAGNFTPEIEYFTANKDSFEYDEEITFSWKTINADNVTIKPFGNVQPIGSKTYKIKDFRNKQVSFELIAVNSTINRLVKKSLILNNRTYKELYDSFLKEFELKKQKKEEQSNHNVKNETINNTADVQRFEKVYDYEFWVTFVVLCIALVILFVYTMST